VGEKFIEGSEAVLSAFFFYRGEHASGGMVRPQRSINDALMRLEGICLCYIKSK
jgi:hypothetical protein